MKYTDAEKRVMEFQRRMRMSPDQEEQLRMLLNEAYCRGVNAERARARKSVAELLEEREERAKNGPWQVACGGKEPVMVVKGYRVQYMFQPTTGRHAYYCLDTDIFLTDTEAEALLS